MAKYKKILVAYDGSATARNALAVAAKLARQDNSWIKVLAVVPPYAGELELIGVSNIKETIEGPGEELLAEALEIADHEGVHVLTNLAQGEPFERISAIADDENCDLIIMGRQGISHLERELIGSVTARVIGHTCRNVLVVPENFKWDGTWESVLLATDGSANSDVAYDEALQLAKDRSVRIAAIAVAKTDTNNESVTFTQAAARELETRARSIVSEFKEIAAESDIHIETFVKLGEPHQEITALAAELGATAIVMSTYGKAGLKRLLMGSVTQRTIGFSDCPVLVVH
ncbi:MAG: universal stress protein [Desulfobulbaceae bacterium]|nr:universal stress protein [Desulfobulbaceae bacterium]